MTLVLCDKCRKSDEVAPVAQLFLRCGAQNTMAGNEVDLCMDCIIDLLYGAWKRVPPEEQQLLVKEIK